MQIMITARKLLLDEVASTVAHDSDCAHISFARLAMRHHRLDQEVPAITSPLA